MTGSHAATTDGKAPRKRVTTTELQAQINEMREQLVGVRRNKELGHLVGQHNGQIKQLQIELNELAKREKDANSANYDLLKAAVGDDLVRLGKRIDTAFADLRTQIQVEARRNDAQDMCLNEHDTRLHMVEEGLSALARAVYGDSGRRKLALIAGVITAVVTFILWTSVDFRQLLAPANVGPVWADNPFVALFLSVGTGGFVAAVILLLPESAGASAPAAAEEDEAPANVDQTTPVATVVGT